MLFRNGRLDALEQKIDTMQKHGVEKSDCLLSQQRLKTLENTVTENKALLSKMGEGLSEQGKRIGDLESFEKIITRQNLDERVTDTQYAVKAFTESMGRLEQSIEKFTKGIVDSVEELRKENSELKEASSSKNQEHQKAVLFANMGEKILTGLILAAILAVCTYIWKVA